MSTGQSLPSKLKEKRKKEVKKSNVDEAQVQLHMGIFVQKW